MTTWQRRILLGTIIGLAALVNVAFNYAGPSFVASEWYDWSYAMLGGLFAQVTLLAVWAGWGQQPITVRVPWAMGVTALLALTGAWGEARNDVAGEADLAFPGLVLLVAVIQILLLILLRRRWGWQIGAANERVSCGAPRFSLRQLLLWISAAAGLLALARCIAPRQAASLEEIIGIAPFLAIGSVILAIVLLPPVISGVCLALRGRKRGYAAACLAGTFALTTAVLFLIILTMMMSDWSGSMWEVAMEAVGVVVPFQAGLMLTLFIGLVVVHCCDFRLSCNASEMPVATALDAPTASGFMKFLRRRQTRFSLVIAGSAIVVALLLRPAIVIEQARLENVRRAAIQGEWAELGTSVNFKGEQIFSVRFQSGLPVSEQVLAKICSPRHVATIRHLDFTGALLKDEQLKRVAELTNLESLTLVGTPITDAGLLNLQPLNNLKNLNLASTRIGDEGLRALEGMSRLEGLCLNQTNVTDAGLTQLQPLKGLISLGLAGVLVTDDGLRDLQSLQNLQCLLLHNTKISDAALQPLSDLKNLKMVTLQGSRVSHQAAAEFYRTHRVSGGPYTAASNSMPTIQGIVAESKTMTVASVELVGSSE